MSLDQERKEEIISLSNETVVDDNSSVFSYDLSHDASTYTNDSEFKPVGSDIPPHVERRLTDTHHKDERPDMSSAGIGAARTEHETELEPHQHIERRRSSVSVKRRSSRKATGSFGGDEELGGLTSGPGQPGLFFDQGLPTTTSGASNS